jgi:hypothetical protein
MVHTNLERRGKSCMHIGMGQNNNLWLDVQRNIYLLALLGIFAQGYIHFFVLGASGHYLYAV